MGLFAWIRRQGRRHGDRENVLRFLRDERAKRYPLPTLAKEGDVGYDLVCVEDTVVPPGLLPPIELPTGLRAKLPRGTWGLLMLRSSTHSRYPTLVICNAPIDNGYVGHLNPRLRNLGNEPVLVPAGTAIVQLVLYRSVTPGAVEVEELPETERGSAKYGSTGK